MILKSGLILFLISLVVLPFIIQREKQTLIPNGITLDGLTYIDGEPRDRKQLVNAFLSVSIPTSMSDNVDGNHFSSVSDEWGTDPFYDPENFRKNYPWLYPFLYEVKKPPQLLVVNKWVKPVRISLGLPNDSFAFSTDRVRHELGYAVHHGKQSDAFIKAKEIIALEANRLAPELAKIAGLDVNFVAHETPNDLPSVSNVRIILRNEYEVLGWKEKFKRNRGSYVTASGMHRTWRGIERRFVTAIPFTHLSDRQVDGYFISNEDNEIEFAVCYIWVGHEELMLIKLTQECLVRSLGFVGFPRIYNSKSMEILSAWNEPLDPKKGEIPIADYPGFSLELSELDKFFIKTMYSPTIKPGMPYHEVYDLLIQ